jgi:hypothetical protein
LGWKQAQPPEPREQETFEIKRFSTVRGRLGSGSLDFIQTSARSRNQAKDVRPILFNNAGPNAVHTQQFGFIPGCGRSDTKQRSIAKDPKCRNPPALGFT